MDLSQKFYFSLCTCNVGLVHTTIRLVCFNFQPNSILSILVVIDYVIPLHDPVTRCDAGIRRHFRKRRGGAARDGAREREREALAFACNSFPVDSHVYRIAV